MDKLNIDGVVGDPVNPYLQQYSDTCAIKSQQIILQEYGINVTEDELARMALENGWYNEGGTLPADVGNLIQAAGIPVSRVDGANIYDLAEQLANGHKIIVGVDANELWKDGLGGIWEWLRDLFVGEQANHALIVAGIDNTDPDNPMVLLTDPGTGEVCKPYPLDQFMDAWSDSNHFMMSTEIPTPQCMANFEAAGITDMHLPEVAGVPYDNFLDFQAYSHQIDPSMMPQLYDLYTQVPTMIDFDLNQALADMNMPLWQPELFPTSSMAWNLWDYDYNDFGFNLDPTLDVDTTTPYDQHRADVLNDLLNSAQTHHQQCLDDGLYISATMWQNQINDLQSEINDLGI